MFKAAIFDLDGTLAYTIDDLRTAMNLMLKDMGYPERSVQEIHDAINCGAREFVRRSLPQEARENEELVDQCHKTYAAYYDIHYLDTTYLYNGIAETVDELKTKGLKLGVLSNKGDTHTKKLISKLFPEGTFVMVLGNSGLFPTKPDPTSALYMAKELDVNPEEVLYIGDSNVDMETAKNAGFFACGVTWGYRDEKVLLESGADKLVYTPKQITDLLQI